MRITVNTIRFGFELMQFPCIVGIGAAVLLPSTTPLAGNFSAISFVRKFPSRKISVGK